MRVKNPNKLAAMPMALVPPVIYPAGRWAGLPCCHRSDRERAAARAGASPKGPLMAESGTWRTCGIDERRRVSASEGGPKIQTVRKRTSSFCQANS